MGILGSFFILISISSVTFIMTLILKNYLLSRNLLVIPDLRSSHSNPKPQGGGLSIILCLVISLFLLDFFGFVERDKFLFFLIPGLFIAFIGFLDDFGEINLVIRLFVQFSVACLGLYLIGGFPVISLFGYELASRTFCILFGIIYIVWMINLYNFMDGIDGLVPLESLFIFSVISIISKTVLLDSSLSFILAILCSVILGFLILNFPKAKIFLGDVGSTFLGVIISLISIYSSLNNPELFWSWLILLGVFIVDSTFTLLRRIFLKEKFYLPHSLHAYQKIARKLNSHSKTSMLVVLLNIMWLTPLAFLVALNKIEGVLGFFLAYIPLIFIAYYYEAGSPEKQGA